MWESVRGGVAEVDGLALAGGGRREAGGEVLEDAGEGEEGLGEGGVRVPGVWRRRLEDW